MWGGIVNTPSPEKPVITVCSWCPDALERTEQAMAAGLQITHGICPRCLLTVDSEPSLTVPEVRAWGTRLIARLAVHRQKLANAGCQSYADGVDWAMNELDGALRGFLDGMRPSRG